MRRAIGIVAALMLGLGTAWAATTLRPGACGQADEQLGQLAPGLQAKVAGHGHTGQRAATINHGSFGGPPYALIDPNAVQFYKNQAGAVAGGTYASDYEYKTLEATLISFDGGSTYVTDRGGCIYIQTVVTGLQTGDIVEVDNNYYYDDGTGYYSYWDQTPYWVLINPYTHNSTQTINNWLIYFYDAGDGTYTMVIGSGEYDLAGNTDDLTTILGDRFRLTRDVKVWTGATLLSPLTSSRGYTYSNTGITGGTLSNSAALDHTDMTYVGVPEAWVDDDWLGHSNGDAVGGHVFGQDAFATITAAIGAVTGSTVYVAPGLYEEQVEIDVNGLELIGSGSGNNPAVDTIIRSPVGPLAYHFNSGAAENYPVIGVHNATGVSIESLRVDGYGRGNANYRFVGIGFWNAGGAVSDCFVTNIQDATFNGSQHGVGIYAYNNTGGPYTIDVTDTTVADFQKTGMALSGIGLTASVTDCHATGKGFTSVTAQNGIQLGFGASGSVNDCDVSGIGYVGSGWTGTGILAYQGGTVAVHGGSVTGSQTAIGFVETHGSVAGVQVNAGDIDWAEGVDIYDVGGAKLRADARSHPVFAPLDEGNWEQNHDRGTPTAVTISDVKLVGTGRTNTYGVFAWTEGPDNLAVTLTDSQIMHWEIGAVAYEYGGAGQVTLTANNNSIAGNDFGYYAGTAGVQNAENNWWGSGEGPLDATGTYEVSSGDCGPSVADMINILPTGGLGNAVSENVDYCPWVTARLTLEGATCQNDVRPGTDGYQIAVELWMRGLTQNVTGFQAFVAYDTGKLHYRGDLSSYTGAPFNIHITSINQTDDGALTLDGNSFAPTAVDAKLATLIFTVDHECDTAEVVFDLTQGFNSELSYQGNALATGFVDTNPMYLDDTAPVISPEALAQTVECDGAGNAAELATWLANHGGASATDNCGGTLTWTYTPNPAVLSDLCCATGAVTVTFRVTDPCGNYDETTATFTVRDTTPPTIATPASDLPVECDGSGNTTELSDWLNSHGGAAATDVCCDGTITWTHNFTGLSDLCCATGAATVTFKATDGCGNFATTTATFTIVDTTAPVISGCPTDIDVPADAGVCTAVVNWTEPNALDACCGSVPWTTRSHAPGSTFAVGTTTVTYTFTDGCGRTATCVFDVTVRAFNVVQLTVQLVGVNPTLPTLTRCIHFVVDQCSQVADASLVFNSSGLWTGSIEVPCGNWTFLCGKDEQHTKWATVALTDMGADYHAGTMSLVGGDTDNDGDVDINDVTWFIYQWDATPTADDLCPRNPARDADFDDNGHVYDEDYTFLTSAWLTQSSCGCHTPFRGGGAQVELQAQQLPQEVLAVVDVNGDGVVDFQDVRLFEDINGLAHDLSDLIEAEEGQATPVDAQGVQPVRLP